MTRSLLSSLIVLAFACGGTPKKKQDTGIENDQAGESCCCRIETLTPDDPTYAKVGVMECSVRHGTCLKTEAQCDAAPGGPDEPGTPTSF